MTTKEIYKLTDRYFRVLGHPIPYTRREAIHKCLDELVAQHEIAHHIFVILCRQHRAYLKSSYYVHGQ